MNPLTEHFTDGARGMVNRTNMAGTIYIGSLGIFDRLRVVNKIYRRIELKLNVGILNLIKRSLEINLDS